MSSAAAAPPPQPCHQVMGHGTTSCPKRLGGQGAQLKAVGTRLPPPTAPGRAPVPGLHPAASQADKAHPDTAPGQHVGPGAWRG